MADPHQQEVAEILADTRVVPVVVLDSADDAATLGRALLAGGLPIAEVTLRTPAAAGSIRAMSELSGMCVGAGTVLTPEQVDLAVEAGARFVVSPGFSAAVVDRCQDHGVTVFPGVATATEVQAALEAGLTTVKFFPASQSGGPSAVAALAAPFGMMTFIPTGGIGPATAADYWRLPSVLAVGGSWMVERGLVREGRFDEVTRRAAAAVSAARAAADGPAS